MMRPLWNEIAGLLLAAIIVTGNGLVIYLITTRRNLRTTTNFFVLSLAVADFGVGVGAVCTIVPPESHTIAEQVLIYIWYFPIAASVFNLCALTLDRYLAIVKPLRYITFMTKKRVFLLIFAAWSVALLVIIPHIVLSGKRFAAHKQKYVFISFALPNVFALLFLLFATARIFLIARKHSRQNAAVVKQLSFNHALHCKVSEPQEAAAAKMVYIVVAVFVSFSLLNIYFTFCQKLCNTIVPESASALELLLLANSAVNPIAYAHFKREIRKELKRLFCGHYFCRSH